MAEQEITIVKGDRRAVFSRGILAQVLAQAGARMEMAYRIASEVRAELLAEERYLVEEEEVLARARAKLQIYDALVVSRLDKWRILRETTEPVIVLIGGATGVGTSTLAADVARRLNIQSVIGTDSIREILRRAISPDLLPTLHKSSYNVAREDIRVPVADEELVLYGYRSQASQVAVGVEALVERGLKEGTNLVIEGVHLAPEIVLDRYRDHPNVCSLVVYLSDPEVHRDRFHVRALGTSMRRPAEEYIAHFEQIRKIHDYIRESARRLGTYAVENISIEATSDAAVAFVANRISGMAEKARGKKSSLLIDAGGRA
ncbi:MAG: 2-phosphoglycerate kinase [Rubrobacteraceae bacterium]|uniref:2-phosphoglycerate kinase n=1 Tax=Rubrobacter naiadicus TaxID=1392641 RepID=UPI0023626D8A|nr:2-phosphoglycerate kinase [Rubrobacter naiadicus]MBX6763159.1 2-phosphoglycerate kinase [Rubrobacteraceae bacterium]MCL6437556.1 2-phosphoglycerate kinase [Rubrobacteraceae bacterium]